MTPSDLPEPPADIDTQRLVGAWYVLVSNDELWRGRTHPRIDYDALAPTADGRVCMLESRRFRAPDLLGRERPRLVVRTSVVERPGQFSSRGAGLRRLVTRRWCVAIVDPEYRWTVTCYARSSLGAPAGLSVHTRDPWISQAQLGQILARVRGHVYTRERCSGLVAPVQHWIPPQPYQLD